MKERIAAERAGEPFVVYREATGSQCIVPLEAGRQFMIGRRAEAEIRLDWDARVSGLHAELRRLGSQWLVVDDGLSRNGTYLNGERVVGRRRLRDGDQLRVGRTALVFRDPLRPRVESTAVSAEGPSSPELSPAQRRVLVALCRPFRDGAAFARPATNQQIADDLCLTVAAVKTHLRALFQRFGLEQLPQNEKRARLVQLAFDSGAVTPAALERP